MYGDILIYYNIQYEHEKRTASCPTTKHVNKFVYEDIMINLLIYLMYTKNNLQIVQQQNM